jgi:hypothetical protein
VPSLSSHARRKSPWEKFQGRYAHATWGWGNFLGVRLITPEVLPPGRLGVKLSGLSGDAGRLGLVVAIFDVHKPRGRYHVSAVWRQRHAALAASALDRFGPVFGGQND